MELAENIIQTLERNLAYAKESLTKAKADCDVAQTKRDVAWEAQINCESDNYDELSLATARAEAELEYCEKWRKYCLGWENGMEVALSLVDSVVKAHEKNQNRDWFDDSEAIA